MKTAVTRPPRPGIPQSPNAPDRPYRGCLSRYAGYLPPKGGKLNDQLPAKAGKRNDQIIIAKGCVIEMIFFYLVLYIVSHTRLVNSSIEFCASSAARAN